MVSVHGISGAESTARTSEVIRVPMTPHAATGPSTIPATVQCRRMVGWYDPGQLIRTGVEVAISGVLGRHSDHRLIEALGGSPPEYYDYADRKGDFWIDYVADIGDGWDPTYAVARAIARLSSEPMTRERGFTADIEECSGRRAEVLVLGGDEVYPVASRQNYLERADLPYRMAFSTPRVSPDVFAVPGNHDWYDSLVAFNRRFCASENFAGCPTRQRRSYFALRLPHNWWLCGTDLQLGSDVDSAQVEYFRAVLDEARREAKSRTPNVILCHAEPLWVYREKYGHMDPTYLDSNLRKLEQEIFQGSVRVFLAGDQHHYLSYGPPSQGASAKRRPPLAVWPALRWLVERKPSNDERSPTAPAVWKITSGGGGAFLHPTHEKPTVLAGGLELRGAWPSRPTSFLFTFWNLAFLIRNPLFGVVTAFLYFFTCASVNPDLPPLSWNEVGVALTGTIRAVVATPAALFWVVVVLGAFMLLTDTRSKWFRYGGGFLHGLFHLGGAFALGWAASTLCEHCIGDQTLRRVVTGLMVFVGGWLLGSIIMGGYLLLSLLVCGRHANETFSALRLRRYKNFLRLRISESGELTIFPIGLRRVRNTRREGKKALERAREAKDALKRAGEKQVQNPLDVGDIDVPPPVGPLPDPELIEPPIRISPCS